MVFCRIPPRSGSGGLPFDGAGGVLGCGGFLDCSPFGVVNPSSSFSGLLLIGAGTGMFTLSDFSEEPWPKQRKRTAVC